MIRSPGARASGFIGAVALPSLLLTLPLWALLTRALFRPLPQWAELFLRPKVAELLTGSIALSGLVLVFSTVLALPLAWLTARRTFAGKNLALGLMTLPLGLPGYVSAWSLLGLGGLGGIIHQWTGWLLPQPRGVVGAAVAMTLYSFPLLAWNLRQGFLSLDVSLEESARLLGKNQWQRFVRVVLPQLKPAFFSGWTVLVLYVLSDFGVPYLFGVEVLASAIYVEITSSFDQTSAAALSSLSLLLSSFLLILLFRGRPESQMDAIGKHRGEHPYSAPSHSVRAWFFLLALLAPSFLIPLISLSHWLSRAGLWETFTAYNRLFQSITGSLGYSLAAALLGTTAALGIALVKNRRLYPLSSASYFSAILPYSLPGTALGLGWVLVFLHIFPGLYQTSIGFILALSVPAAALASGPLQTALASQPKNWHQGALLLGKSRIQSFVRVVLPGLVPAIAGSFVLAMGWIVRELPLSLLLSPIGTQTLPMAVFGRTVEADYAGAAPYALVLVLFGGFLGWLAGNVRRSENA